MAFPQPQQNDTSVEETLASFESIPLFMKSLPEDAFNDTAISALQSLVHEGTPDGTQQSCSNVIMMLILDVEIAQNFKDQGNNYFKGKRYREALGFYAQAIDSKPTDPVLLEALFCNSAACNLELSKYFVLPKGVCPLTTHPEVNRKLWHDPERLFKGLNGQPQIF